MYSFGKWQASLAGEVSLLSSSKAWKKNRQTGRQAGRQAGRQTDKQTNKQTNKQTIKKKTNKPTNQPTNQPATKNSLHSKPLSNLGVLHFPDLQGALGDPWKNVLIPTRGCLGQFPTCVDELTPRRPLCPPKKKCQSLLGFPGSNEAS